MLRKPQLKSYYPSKKSIDREVELYELSLIRRSYFSDFRMQGRSFVRADDETLGDPKRTTVLAQKVAYQGSLLTC